MTSVMVCGPMSEGVTAEATICSEGVGVGDLSTTCEKVSKLISCRDRGERRVRDRTSGVVGTKSVGSSGRFTKSEQEVEPLEVSRSANKGEVTGESCTCFIIRRNDGSRRTNK